MRPVDGLAKGPEVSLRLPDISIDLCLEGGLEAFVGVILAKKVGLPHNEALAIAVAVDEPASDGGGLVAAHFTIRPARQGPATSEWRSAAEPNFQIVWLVKPLPRSGAWKGLRRRPQSESFSSVQVEQAATLVIELHALKPIRLFAPLLLLLSIFNVKFLLLDY